ncbi:MAG: class I SAM-dependent methyltransferase [Chloroflexota bacterium]
MSDREIREGIERDTDARFKQSIASLYDRAAPIYDQVGPSLFQQAAARLVDLAGVAAGARVLDVGTGRGAVLLAVAGRVGPTGVLVGIDLSEGMVREAVCSTGLITGAGYWPTILKSAPQDRISRRSYAIPPSEAASFHFISGQKTI